MPTEVVFGLGLVWVFAIVPAAYICALVGPAHVTFEEMCLLDAGRAAAFLAALCVTGFFVSLIFGRATGPKFGIELAHVTAVLYLIWLAWRRPKSTGFLTFIDFVLTFFVRYLRT